MEGVGMSTFWQDRRVLVTGASGLLGTWLIRDLVDKGADPICLVRDWVPSSDLVRSDLIDEVVTVRGDVRDQDVLERALGEYEVPTVFHFAAQTIVGIASRNPTSTWESNIRGTWTLLEACRRSPLVEEIVVASTDKAYGEKDDLPYTEDMPLDASHPYDVSKACADRVTRSYAATFGLPVSVTRCGNLYGGGDLNWNRLVPGTIRSVVRGDRPVIRSDGSPTRDYLYVEDASAAYLHLAQHMANDPSIHGQAYNFSPEKPLSVEEMVDRILNVMGSDLEPDVRGEADDEIDHQYLSAEKARQDLDWKPRFTVDEGLERTVAWYRDFLTPES